MSFLLKLRTAARGCSNVDYRYAMLMAADEVAGRITLLYNDPSEAAMMALNGAWATAVRLLKDMPPEAAPDPLGGSCEPARLAA